MRKYTCLFYFSSCWCWQTKYRDWFTTELMIVDWLEYKNLCAGQYAYGYHG